MRTLLDHHRAAVIAVAEALIEREELDSDEIEALIRQAEAPSLGEIAASALAEVPPAGSQPPAAIPAPAANGHFVDAERVVEGELAESGPPATSAQPWYKDGQNGTGTGLSGA